MSQPIAKVYSGREGACMCGCAGKWTYSQWGALHHNPGYDVTDSISERGVKIISGRVLNNPNRIVDDSADCVYTVENGRMRAVYFK